MRRAAAALVACGIILGPAPTALSAPEGDAIIETDAFNVPFDSEGDGHAFCPAGTRVVGGGVTSTTAGSSSISVNGPLDQTGLASQTTDGDIGRSWYAKVYNAEPGGERTFKATAICSRRSDATLRLDSFTLVGLGEDDGQAFCPAGTRLIGGGLIAHGTALAELRLSGPLDETGLTLETNDGDVGRSWYAKVIQADDVTTYKSAAICSRTSDATLRTDAFSPMSAAGDGQAFCPAGTRVVGGGVTGTGNSTLFVSGPLDATGLTSNLNDGDVGRSWYAALEDLTSGTYKSTAICAAPSPVPRCAGRRATKVGTAGPERLVGTARRDVIVGLGGRDRIRGLAGRDLLCGGRGRDRLVGGRGRDRLRGGGGRDGCLGGAGADAAAGCERRRGI